MKLNFGFGEEWKNLKKFETLSIEDKSIVFYAENIASINHFHNLIKKLTEEKNLDVCYVTSEKKDLLLNEKNKKIKTFYIGDGVARTKFFSTLKAKILIMDMPDLETFHIKRSKIYPVHYIYLFHSMFSIHSYLRKGAVDNYDTIFCVGKHHVSEIKESEKIYNLKPKKLVEYGFGRLDGLLEKRKQSENNENQEKLILITPSYGKQNLLEVCGKKLISDLIKKDFQVLLRPHFRIFQDNRQLIDSIQKEFSNESRFTLHDGIIPFEKFHNSLCLISDWSGISFEYAFTHEKPVIFIDVPKKKNNVDLNKFSTEPIEVNIRKQIGEVVLPNEVDKIPKLLEKFVADKKNYENQIRSVCKNTVYNIGTSSEIGTKYILELLENEKIEN